MKSLYYPNGDYYMSGMRTRCFVIMPFSQSSDDHTEEYWTNHFNNFLKPLIEEIPEVEAYRVESLHGDIIKQIITDLMVAPIVVAELTDHNPNVFWELGVRQSFKYNTITIAEEGTKLPFDVSIKATLFYNPSSHLKMEEFRKKLKQVISECLTKPNQNDSYVLDIISGRGSLYELMRLDEAIRRLDSLLEEIRRNKDNYNKRRVALLKIKDITELPSEIGFFRYQTQSAEFLLTTKYLDEDKVFYRGIREYLYTLNSFNDQSILRHMLTDTEKKAVLRSYMQSERGGINKIFEYIIRNCENVYKKLNKRVLMYSSGITNNK